MKLFVTGGTGFIGSHFLNSAMQDGHTIRALRRPASSPRLPLIAQPQWIQTPFAEVSVRDFDGCECLVHLLSAGVSPQRADWEEHAEVNIRLTLRLLLLALEAGVRRLVVCGTYAEYGLAADRYDFLPPDAPLEPIGAYAGAKAAASVAAMALARERAAELVVARPFSVFGPGQHSANFFPALERAAQSGTDFPMTPGAQVRDFVPVVDVARDLVRCCLAPKVKPGCPFVVHLASGQPVRLLDFALARWTEWGARGQILAGSSAYRLGEIMRFATRPPDFSAVS